MTSISNIRAALETMIDGVVTGYTKIANPYELEKISNVILRKGYGIAFGPGANTNRELCQMSVDREFSVVLTREVAATEHDADGRETVEKAIFEDQHLIIKAIEADASVGGTASRGRYISDGGIEYVGIENSRYYALVSNFAIEYFEQLT